MPATIVQPQGAKLPQSPPSEFRRVIWISTAFGFLNLPFSPYDFFAKSWWTAQTAHELAALLLPAAIGFAFGASLCRAIWELDMRKMPLWPLFAGGAFALAGLAGLIYVRETGIWVWPMAAGDAFLSMLGFGVATISLINERKHHVRVYLGAARDIFVPSSQPKLIKGVTAFVAIATFLVAWVGVLRFYDEPLDAGLESFYARSPRIVPDEKNAAIALKGLSAPVGENIIAHGRYIADANANAGSNGNDHLIRSRDKLVLSGDTTKFDCWIWPHKPSNVGKCADGEVLRKTLADNALLLERYRFARTLPQYEQIGLGQNGGMFIQLNKLIAAEIALDLREGRAESAYRKWRENHQFLTREIGAEANKVEKVIWAAAESISLSVAEEMLFLAPQLRIVHTDEFLAQFSASGAFRWNPKGVLRAEYWLANDTLSGNLQNWVHPNYLRNRQYRAAKAAMARMQAMWTNSTSNVNGGGLDADIDNVWTLDYLLHGKNVVFSRYFSESARISESMASALQQKSGLMRLLVLTVQLAKANPLAGEIQTFINQSNALLRNPFDNEPMKWNAKNGVIYFCRPNQPAKVEQVRLPGGNWVENGAELCGAR